MPDPFHLSPRELRELASRLLTASKSTRVPGPLRADLLAASLTIRALLRIGAIKAPVDLREGE
jgi:hypothetical protein